MKNMRGMKPMAQVGGVGRGGRRGGFKASATRLLAFACGPSILLLLVAHAAGAQNLSFEEIEKLPASPADHRIAYGDGPLQFGDLRLPKGRGPHPVVVVVHGGCWYSEYNLNHVASFGEALTRMGVATWSIEYRRVGDAGGGWPGTFEDVARATDYLRVLARTYRLDLRRVVVVGHSAGGQLALWLAGRKGLPPESPLSSPDPLPLRGVVSLAGINDLRGYGPGCGNAVAKLLGGSPEEMPQRYRQASPIELLPLKVKQRLIHGLLDRIVPLKQSSDYEAAARLRGDDVKLFVAERAGHFDLISPLSSTWPAVQKALRELLVSGGPKKRAAGKGARPAVKKTMHALKHVH